VYEGRRQGNLIGRHLVDKFTNAIWLFGCKEAEFWIK
jgi:hypothetical protein